MSDTDTASSPRSLATLPTLPTLTSPDRVLFLAMKGRLLCLLAVLCAILSLPARAAIEASETLDDFEGGIPGGFFIFNGSSTVVAMPILVSDADPLAQPGQAGDNGILLVDYNVSDFGGFGESFELAGAQDWSRYTSFDFWFYGTGSGLTYQAEISDNRSDPNIDTSERFDYAFVDDTPGWQYISIPFEYFTRATDFQPGGAPDDGFTLTEIYAWAIVLPLGADTVFFDDVGLGQRIVDDFESGLPSGFDTNGTPIAFFTFSDGSSAIGISTSDIPPAPLPPAVGVLNNVLQVDLTVTAFAGLIHSFENEAVDTWIAQDWSRYSGISLWIYGNNSGTPMFIDLLENRNPGSTADDAERWTVDFVDDFSGWQRLEFPFAGFSRKEIGNGAPNDGLTLQSVHGWAFGTLGTGGPLTYYLDGVALFGAAEVPPLTVGFATSINKIDEGTTGNVVVALNRPMNADDPAQVSVDFFTDSTGATATANRDYITTSGTLIFVNGGPTELSFPIETLEDTKFEGTERFGLQLANPVNVDLDLIRTASGIIEDNDPFDPFLLDDFEQGAFLWQADPDLFLNTPEIASSDPWARPGQDPFERILEVSTPIAVDMVIAGSLCNKGNGVVPVAILTTDNFDATTVDHTTVRFGAASETHGNRKGVKRHEEDFDGDGDLDLVFHFRVRETGYDCGEQNTVLTGTTFDGHPITAGGEVSFGRDFPLGQDWSEGEALRFWFYGTGSGDSINVTVKDNRAPDPGPSGWNLVWADEFNDPAGTPPDPANWSYEIGDISPDGKNGWGNEELQYYTDDPANAATDGAGNLALTVREGDDSIECYYGPCEFTSARLISKHKQEFAYGRIESRILVPQGTGLWPSFWGLGTDIDRNPWPGAGQMDIMAFVGRLPNETFGTIHGPGYAGGQSFGNLFVFGEPVFNDYHTFTIEWEPNLINWYVDGILFHTASPDDVAPNPWVFNDPIYLLLNVAVGGNFGGPVGPDLFPPQSMLVDYVRVYQGPDTAERFEASFVDNFSGWQEVVIPFASLARSAVQPDGAPDDGLNLNEVWGYGFSLPDGGTSSGGLLLDMVRVQPAPAPAEITVTNLGNSGPGSLRQAIADVTIGGTITLDPALAGGTIALTAGPLILSENVTIDASSAPGVSLNGGGVDRVLIVDAGVAASLSHLIVTNGFGFQIAGGILNSGDLTLDHVTVTGNVLTTDAVDFWQGGGGIYNSEGATLNLLDSTVADNVSDAAGAGIYGFFNTEIIVQRSTISGNVSQEVGGGFRILGNLVIDNSTVSGNQSIAWHGGAGFLTDGTTTVSNSTIIDNNAPSATAGGFFIGTFSDDSATLNLVNNIIAFNGDFNCSTGFFGGGSVSLNSLGNNVVADGSANPVASDLIVADPGIGALADNGGPTRTHALLPGSPAIDAASPIYSPAIDQRGVSRPQQAAPDIGSFEYIP